MENNEGYGIPDKMIRMVKIMYDDCERSVLDEGEQKSWFKISSGVKQGCIMSGFLFLLDIGYAKNNRRTKKWHQMELHNYS